MHLDFIFSPLSLFPALFPALLPSGTEVTGAYCVFMENRTRPTCIVLSRSGAPHLPGTSRDKVAKGAYVLSDTPGFNVVLAGSGQEVALCLEAKKTLEAQGHKVGSFFFSSASSCLMNFCDAKAGCFAQFSSQRRLVLLY